MSDPARAATAPRVNKPVNVVRRALERTIVDSHLQPRAWGELPLRTAAWWSLKHRAQLTSNERRLASLKDKHRGERCFILGNGPSLNECDLTRLRGETTFGVNSIFLNSDAMGFTPTYYVVEDILVAEDRARQIDAFKGPQKFFGNYLRRFLGEGPDVLWTNVRVDYRDYANFPHFSHDAVRQLWVGGTVSYICLQLAYHMGFSDVHLVGFDHNYSIPADAKIDGNRIETTSTDPNHFHPDYFGKGYRWHNPRVDRMEIAYVRAKREFEAAGRRVSNATVGGKLEVFDRVNYEALFSNGADREAASGLTEEFHMSETSTIAAIVPMRHDSERVKGKNYRPLGGVPLFAHIVRTLLACPSIGEVVIDTDSPTIKRRAAKDFPDITIVDRPKALRAGETPMNDVLLNTIKHVEADLYLQTHSTNPLLSVEAIETAIAKFRAGRGRNDSLFGVTKIQQRLWDGLCNPINHDPAVLMRTQDLSPIYVENSCLYLFSKESLVTSGNRIGKSPMMFEIDKLEAQDIDDEADFALAEMLYQRRQNERSTREEKAA